MHRTKTEVDFNKALKYIQSSTTKSTMQTFHNTAQVCLCSCFCFNTVCMIQNRNQLNFQTNSPRRFMKKNFNWPKMRSATRTIMATFITRVFNSSNNENISSFYHWIERRLGVEFKCPRLQVLFLCVCSYDSTLFGKQTYLQHFRLLGLSMFIFNWMEHSHIKSILISLGSCVAIFAYHLPL